MYNTTPNGEPISGHSTDGKGDYVDSARKLEQDSAPTKGSLPEKVGSEYYIG